MPQPEENKNITHDPSPGRILDPVTGRTRSRAELATQAQSLVLRLLSTHFTLMIRHEHGIGMEQSRCLEEAFQVQLGHVIDLVAEGIATDRVLF